ncbi:hypothetical protein Ab1vBOLIVR4_gp22 [Agrobacterium phage OLIVR4]|nr:hypothetical protein Ab1vBOLIVR4_gp22 [Agrobacterium phage OLIVR4]
MTYPPAVITGNSTIRIFARNADNRRMTHVSVKHNHTLLHCRSFVKTAGDWRSNNPLPYL